MDLKAYQAFVEHTTSYESKDITEFMNRLDDIDMGEVYVNAPLLLTAAIGLGSESGEFQEIVKKVFFQGKELTKDVQFHMIRELGDICWYLANAANALDVSLEDILKENEKKLKARYPNGFEIVRSENRAVGDL